MSGRFFFTTDMTNFKEQRIYKKFCFNLEKTAAETHRMLQEAFGDNATSLSKASRMDECLSLMMSVLDDRRQAQHRKTAKVHEAILADRRQTIHDVCEIVGLSYGTVRRILTDNLDT